MSARANLIVLGIAFSINLLLLLLLPVKDVANVLLVTVAVKATALTALYGLRSPWRATEAGRAVMLLVSSLALIMCQGSVTILTHADYPGRDFVRDALFVCVALALLWLLLTVFRLQQQRPESEERT